MINKEQHGFDPVKLSKTLGLHIEISERVPETNQSDALIAASLRELYKYVLPVYAYILDKNSNMSIPPVGVTLPDEEIDSFDHRDKIFAEIALLHATSVRNNTGQFVKSVIDGFIGSTSVVPTVSKSDRTHSLFSFHSECRRRSQATPEGVLALGILGLHHLGLREMDSEAKRVNQTIKSDRTVRDEKPIFLSAIEPYRPALQVALQFKSDKSASHFFVPIPPVDLRLENNVDELVAR